MITGVEIHQKNLPLQIPISPGKHHASVENYGFEEIIFVFERDKSRSAGKKTKVGAHK